MIVGILCSGQGKCQDKLLKLQHVCVEVRIEKCHFDVLDGPASGPENDVVAPLWQERCYGHFRNGGIIPVQALA